MLTKTRTTGTQGIVGEAGVISLFSGCGGLDLGFRQAGFRAVAAFEREESAVATYNKNFCDNSARVADLQAISVSAFLRSVDAAVGDGPVPVGLIGGPPCQGFSVANVNSVASDPRNQLTIRYAELLEAATRRYRLHFFLLENVAGLAGEKHRAHLKTLTDALAGAGFHVYQSELNAKDFGVAQVRRRLFLVGLNREIYPEVGAFKFPLGTPGKELTVGDAIGGLPEATLFHRGLVVSDIGFHPNHWTTAPKSKKFTSGSSSSGRSFRRLSWAKPSLTVAYGNREIHVHPNGNRRLSIFEAMLLQGFPSNYELLGTLSQQVSQVSDAVPPPMAKALADAIREHLRLR